MTYPSPPPRGRARGVVVLFGAVALLAVFGAAALVVTLAGDDGPQVGIPVPVASSSAPSPGASAADSAAGRDDDRAAVERLVQETLTALNTRDVALSRRLSCEPARVADDTYARTPRGARFTLARPPSITGAAADVGITATYPSEGTAVTRNLKFLMTKRATGWCVRG